MSKRAIYYAELTDISIHCFDIMKYHRLADRLNVSLWANFRGETYYSGDILIDPCSFCTWDGTQWRLERHFDAIKIHGINQILDFLEVNYKEKPHERPVC